ncbi:aspartate aminotransferase family protein [Candidatus Pacearchaeota archaeon]|nr:aspartate aminotransferase family protein [Candidatus Pacearchaeota archaeon]
MNKINAKTKEFLFRDSPPHPLEIINSKGSYLVEKNGKKYLDFMMGWCVGNVGWKREDILKSIKKFKGPEYVSPTYIYRRWEHLAEKIVNILPKRNGTCFRATGGTEANEIALKMSRAYNKRKKFLAFKEAYHGQSIACLSLVKIPQHEAHFGKFSKDYIQIYAKDWRKTTEEAENLIKKRDISAFISEPIICNLGVIVPPQDFFDAVIEACKETDTLFICDEVATGFGRTGKWFGFEHYGLEPDIITIAKGFSSGYAAIGATIAKPNIAESMRFEFSNYSTFGWHPLSVEAAISNIDYIRKENLVDRANENGKYLIKRLSEFCEPEGKGLCIGFDEKREGTETRCLKDGLIISSLEGRVVLFPPLNVLKTEIDKAVEIIRRNI